VVCPIVEARRDEITARGGYPMEHTRPASRTGSHSSGPSRSDARVTRAAARVARAIDLLGPEEWDPVREAGLVCSMGYPTARRDFIATGFNDRANHRILCGSWRTPCRSPRATAFRM